MDLSRYFFKIILVLCAISILLLIMGHLFESAPWGVLTAQTVSGHLFYPIIAVGIFLIILVIRSRPPEKSPGDGRPFTVSMAVIPAIAAAVILWLLAGGGLFWRNLFSGPISLFGSYSEVIKSYSDLPPNPNLTDLWNQTAVMRIVAALLGGLFVYVLYLLVREFSADRKIAIPAFLFLALSGVLTIFTSANDFALFALLSAILALIALKFISGRVPIYVLGIVLLIAVLFHPVFVLFALALLLVKIAARSLRSNKPLILFGLLVGAAILGGALSALQSFPFTSVFLPSTSASELFTLDHISGLANQLLMVSHVIVLIALLTVVYSFLKPTGLHLRGLLFAFWFVASLAFCLFSYSQYGWIIGYPSSSVVVIPALLWLLYFVFNLDAVTARASFATLAVTGALFAIPLFTSVHFSQKAINTFSSRLLVENAFSERFDDGYNALLLGTMYCEKFKLYDEATVVLKLYHRRFPLNVVGRYEYGWAQTNATTDILQGIDILKGLNTELMEDHKLFWEFNVRMGIAWLAGHNHAQATICLERAAAEKNTAHIAKTLADAYMVIHVLDSMVSKYKQAIALGDSSTENIYRLAYGEEQRGDSADAMKYYKLGIQRYPSYVPNYQYIARYYFLNGKYDSLEALAAYGLSHIARSPALEACLMLVYQNTGRLQQRDSLYNAFIDYFQTKPDALRDWGQFLEDNGMVYEGRKMQTLDVTAENRNLHTILNFYNFYKETNEPDSAKKVIDAFIAAGPDSEIMEVLDAVKRYDTILWPRQK